MGIKVTVRTLLHTPWQVDVERQATGQGSASSAWRSRDDCSARSWFINSTKALPRCERASFWSGVIWAAVRPARCPGTRVVAKALFAFDGIGHLAMPTTHRNDRIGVMGVPNEDQTADKVRITDSGPPTQQVIEKTLTTTVLQVARGLHAWRPTQCMNHQTGVIGQRRQTGELGPRAVPCEVHSQQRSQRVHRWAQHPAKTARPSRARTSPWRASEQRMNSCALPALPEAKTQRICPNPSASPATALLLHEFRLQGMQTLQTGLAQGQHGIELAPAKGSPSAVPWISIKPPELSSQCSCRCHSESSR